MSRKGEKVTAAFCYHGNNFEAEFVLSLLAVKDHDWLSGQKALAHPGWLVAVGGTDLAQSRNSAVRVFLDQTESDWLWFIDTDQGFRGDIVRQLLASADPVERPIVSALVMATRAEGHGLPVSPACVAMHEVDGQPQLVQYFAIPPERHWHVGATGTGCVLIHRSVLEAIGAKHADSPWPWFEYLAWKRPDPITGETVPDVMGEDYAFSLKARALGFPIIVDTRIEASHIKKRTLTSKDFYAQIPPAELEPRNFVVIPTKGKVPKLLKALLRDLERQGGYEEIFVIDNGCTGDIRAWLHAQDLATVVEMPDVGIHEMWNAGAALAQSRYPRYNVAYLNDDITISDGFVEGLAEGLAADDKCVMVCPNWNDTQAVSTIPLQGIAAAGKGSRGLCGWAFMVRCEFFEVAGFRWPTEMKWWFGDNHACLVADRLGLWYGMVPTVSVVHVDGGGKTGNWDDPEMQRQLAADQAAFQAIWADAGAEVVLA